MDKKTTFRRIGILACIIFSLVISSVIFSAKTAQASYMSRKYAKKMTVSIGNRWGYGKWTSNWTSLDFGSRLNGATKVTAKSSNNKIIKPKVVDGNWVVFKQKKAGKATLTVSVWKNSKKTTYKIKVKVVKWKNPFVRFKIGGENYTSQFNDFYWGEASGPYGKNKLSMRLRKGWKIKALTFTKHVNTGGKPKRIKNNSKLDFKEDSFIDVIVVNKKTNQEEKLIMTAKSASVQEDYTWLWG